MQIYSWGKASTTKARYAFGILCAPPIQKQRRWSQSEKQEKGFYNTRISDYDQQTSSLLTADPFIYTQKKTNRTKINKNKNKTKKQTKPTSTWNDNYIIRL